MLKRQTATRTLWRRRLTPAILLILPAVSLIASPSVANAAHGDSSVVTVTTAGPTDAEAAFANDVNALGDQTYPTVYAGDDLLSNGQTAIYVAPGDSTGLVSSIKSLSASSGAPYTIIAVPRSYSELNAISSAIIKNLPRLTAAGLEVSSWAGNPSTGTVDISLATLGPNTSLVQADSIASSIVSPAARITDTTAGPVTLDADRYHDTAPYFGGDNIQGGGVECTDGFEVTVGTTPVMLSAGHCTSETWFNGTTSKEIGVTGQLHFNDTAHDDVQTIKNESYFHSVWSGAFGDPAVGVTVHGGFGGYVSTGQLITIDGSVTKEVRNVQVVASGDNVCLAADGATVCHLVKTNINNQSGVQACQGGDSGGPVYQYAYGNGTQVKAVGLHEGHDSQFCYEMELAYDLSQTGSALVTG